jgi:hypothetical protein
MNRSAPKHGRNARITLTVAVLLACAGLGRATYAGHVAPNAHPNDNGRKWDSDHGNEHDRGKLSVCTHGCKFHNIQRAVDKAQSGDTIDIGPGTYFENVVIDGKNLILAGASADETTIDGDFLGPVLTLSHATVTLTDMTITHGSGENGGGIFVYGSELEMTDVIVVSNVAAQRGGGIGLDVNYADTTFKATRCVIAHNRAPIGAGIYVEVETPLTLIDSTIARNEAAVAGGGVFLQYASDATITNTTISDNTSGGDGGGIWVGGGGVPWEGIAFVFLDHSAVVHNTAAQNGGGVFIHRINALHLLGGTIISLNAPDDVGT